MGVVFLSIGQASGHSLCCCSAPRPLLNFWNEGPFSVIYRPKLGWVRVRWEESGGAQLRGLHFLYFQTRLSWGPCYKQREARTSNRFPCLLAP